MFFAEDYVKREEHLERRLGGHPPEGIRQVELSKYPQLPQEYLTFTLIYVPEIEQYEHAWTAYHEAMKRDNEAAESLRLDFECEGLEEFPAEAIPA